MGEPPLVPWTCDEQDAASVSLLESVGWWRGHLLLADLHRVRLERSFCSFFVRSGDGGGGDAAAPPLPSGEARRSALSEAWAAFHSYAAALPTGGSEPPLRMVRLVVDCRTGVATVSHRDVSGFIDAVSAPDGPLLRLPRDAADAAASFPSVQVEVSRCRTDTASPLFAHKTTRRAAYEAVRASAQASATFDVLIRNAEGRLTEGCFTNLACRVGGAEEGRWVTPPLRDGVLPGVLRARLLAEGAVVEGEVTVEDLEAASCVVCFNSVRGVIVANVCGGAES